MSKRKSYTDAQKAAHYRKKAAAGRKTATGKSKTYYRYKANENALNRVERQKRITDRKEPGYISAAGSMLGSMVHPVAGFLGGKLGHLVEQVTGFGDYKVMNNSVLRGGMSAPQIVNSVNKGEVILRHREYLGDILASTDFTVQSFYINPGLATTFPWLSQIALSYEQYALRGMLFEFNSTSSDSILSSATSTALGTVIMMTDYDVADDPPSTKRQMLNSEWASSAKPSCTFIHPIECKRSLSAQNVLYTRNASALPAGYDRRLYDFARFNIATEGMQANGGVLGELWVTYEISFMKQQLTYPGLADHFRLAGVTNAAPIGTAVKSSQLGGGTLGGVIDALGTTYLFPPQLGSGKYFVSYLAQGSTQSITYPTLIYTNCVALRVWTNDANAQVNPVALANGVSLINLTIQITKQNASFAFPAIVLPTPVTAGDLWVIRLPDTITTFPV